MEEGRYRESRLCRVLGNPLAYSLVLRLIENGSETPTDLANALRRSVHTVSHTLGKLRLTDVVRFERCGRQVQYRLKYPEETHLLLGALGSLEEATHKKR